MKRFVFFALVLVAIVAATARNPADALQSLKAYKYIVLTVEVTPSPVAMLPGGRRAPNVARSVPAPAPAVLPPSAFVTALTQDPYRGGVVRMASNTTSDVPILIAQATPQGNIPVTFNAHPDPTAMYLHIVPHTTTLMAGYGANTFTCPFEVYAYYTTVWKVTDWGQGTVSNGIGAFPIENNPTASNLLWDIPSIGNTTMTVYANSGSPGQTTFSGSASVSQQNCINLSLNVPANIAAGDYTAAIQYNLYAN